MRRLSLSLLSLLLLWSACYSFRGINIPANAKTYYVELFSVSASSAPAEIGQNFTLELTNKIRSESRLNLEENQADIVFQGSVTKFETKAINPEPNARVGSNRLTVEVRVQYEDSNNPDDSWEQSFSYFVDFPADQNLLNIQDQIIEEAFQQITEDIFNKAFTNW